MPKYHASPQHTLSHAHTQLLSLSLSLALTLFQFASSCCVAFIVRAVVFVLNMAFFFIWAAVLLASTTITKKTTIV